MIFRTNKITNYTKIDNRYLEDKNISFKEKIDVLAELFLNLEHDELLPDNIDGYNIATLITKY